MNTLKISKGSLGGNDLVKFFSVNSLVSNYEKMSDDMYNFDLDIAMNAEDIIHKFGSYDKFMKIYRNRLFVDDNKIAELYPQHSSNEVFKKIIKNIKPILVLKKIGRNRIVVWLYIWI